MVLLCQVLCSSDQFTTEHHDTDCCVELQRTWHSNTMVSTPHFMLAICLCMATTAAGHGMMVSPRPRTGSRNAGNNKGRGTSPCGRGAQLQTQGQPVATYTPGQSVDVQWRIDA